MRLDAAVAASFDVRGHSGGKSPAEVTGGESGSLNFTDRETGESVVFSQIVAPETARFYVWKDKRMVNASPVYAGSASLKKGETLKLAYRLEVHAGKSTRLVR